MVLDAREELRGAIVTEHIGAEVSLVIPVLNESECLPILHRALSDMANNLSYRFEFVFVDDGSTDSTFDVIQRIREIDPRVRGVRLSRNFGHQAALCAGLERARGDAVIMMDGDMQHPPELIPVLLEKYELGFDVVNTRRTSTEQTSWMKRFLSNQFYRFFNWFAAVQIESGAADFRLLSRVVVDKLNELPEVHRFLRGLVPWMGFPQTIVSFEAPARRAGVSKYNFQKSARLAIEGLTSFSFHPLRKFAMLGCFLASCAFLYGIVAVGIHLFTHSTVPGWTSMFTMMVFLNGFQFVMLGVLGEYIGRILEQVKSRPLYLVRDETLSVVSRNLLPLESRKSA